MDNELKSSYTWLRLLQQRFSVTLIDPDGWDRKNFEESFLELITKQEFKKRMSMSTTSQNEDWYSKW